MSQKRMPEISCVCGMDKKTAGSALSAVFSEFLRLQWEMFSGNMNIEERELWNIWNYQLLR